MSTPGVVADRCLRPELDAAGLPAHMAHLPVHRGYPVPWFVDWINSVPEFRALNPAKWRQALKDSRCWVCGGRLGTHRVFVLGPMCGINRTSSEPPCHAACAEWSAANCPFLSHPHEKRRDVTDLVVNHGAVEPAGEGLLRNPGVALLWWTKTYRTFPAHAGRPGLLIEIGDPQRVRWIAEGRDATRAEVVASVTGGLPSLREACERERPDMRAEAHATLDQYTRRLEALYPVA